MSYFLKTTNKINGKYLQIYDSSWDNSKGARVSKCIETLGYEEALIKKGISDPTSYYQSKCKEMNQERNNKKKYKKIEKISSENNRINIGSFLVYNFFKTINLNNELLLEATTFNHNYPIDKIFLDLVACRIIEPTSKLKSYVDALPTIYNRHNYTLDNVYQTLDDFGSEYKDIIQIINHSLSHKYKADTSHVFFDCTNFYFEIDREDEIRKKGPSKENRRDPIIGLGLLLDKNCMPIGMKLYPGNQSEKPIQRELINESKRSGNITGKTIVVADKGLNCARNIHQAIENKDGYIYSKSILQLSEKDRSWIFLDNDRYPESAYKRTYDNNNEVIFKIKSRIDEFKYKYEINNNGKKEIIEFVSKEKRVVYYSKELHDKKVYEINKIKSKLNDLILSKAKKEEYGIYGSYVTIESNKKDLKVKINEERINMELQCAGYNMIITSEFKENSKEIYNVYHQLWRIEETFRIMKTDLNARPVYLQKENRIYGHFLVCYLAVVTIRFLQFVLFKNMDVKSNDIISFIQNTEVIKLDDNDYFNISKKTEFMNIVNEVTNTVCDIKYYDKKMLNKMFDSKLKI